MIGIKLLPKMILWSIWRTFSSRTPLKISKTWVITC